MAEWQEVRLGEVALRVTKGTTPPASSFSTRGVHYVKVESIAADGRIDHGKLSYIDHATHISLKRSVLEPDDILFTIAGTIGRVALVIHDLLPANTNQAVAIVRPDRTAVRPGFLYYALRNAKSLRAATARTVQSVQANLSLAELSSIQLSVPPLREQQAIAEVLGALDDKIAANTAVAATLDKLADTEYLKVARLSERGRKTFADIAVVSGGGTPSTKTPNYWDGEVWWATPTDMTALSGPYLRSTSRTISEAGLAACSSKLFAPGAILMTSRATIGSLAVNEVPTAVNQGFIVVEPHEPHMRWWLFHQMRSRIDEFLSWANGATFLELSRGTFKKLPVLIAPDDRIGAFDRFADNAHRLASSALSENDKLAATRDALLPQLMSGKLRVRDAEQIASEAGA